MKKLLTLAVILFASLSMSHAQQQMALLPNDPAVKQGKLENGLTYYIRHNDKPENRAEFYLATNVGAIQETPDQDGLAHFLEHMCFNGTKNFPGKNLLNWLESIGASFGGNVNASTGVEVTQYMLNNIPITRESIIDSCLLVMHDYSHFVLNDPEEIDKERGVIVEERRTRRTASWRLHEQSLPIMYGDTKYAGCTLIGSQENLLNFKPESLVNFYQTWYRPDMQALVVVGDVDVDKIEAKIKAIFADIPAAVNPKAKDVIRIPDNVEPVVGILKDPENASTTFEVLWKSEARPEEMNNTVNGYMIDLATSIIGGVMAERFADICSKPDSPYINASFGFGNVCETMDAAIGTVVAREGEAMPAFTAFMLEIEKMRRFGFTDAEVQRVKDDMDASYESRAKRADSRKNSEFVPALISNFFDNYPYMTPEDEYQVVHSLLPQLSAELLNMLVKQMVTEQNIVVVYAGIDKEGLQHPTEADVVSVIKAVESAEIEAPVAEEIASEFLDSSKLKGSKVKKESSSIYGATKLVLKNGVNVYLLPTEYEKDRISFEIFRQGGSSLIPTEDMPSFEPNIHMLFDNYNGVSSFNATTVSKMLSGKMVSVSQDIDDLYNGVSGASTVKDFETALQLMYLYYTDPRFDKDAFDQSVKTLQSILPNYLQLPDAKMQMEMVHTVYENNPRKVVISEEVLAKASLETIERVTRELYKDAAGCSMIIVGDFDPEYVKPLVEKYVGSLPKGKKAPHWVDTDEDVTRRNVLSDFKTDMQTPKATVVQMFRNDDSYSIQKSVAYSALSYILDMVYVETLREDEGGTYGASANAELNRLPKEYGILQVAFDTNPTLADKLRELAKDGIRGIAQNGPTEEQFDKAKKNMEKNVPERKISNSFWMNSIRRYIVYGEDYVSEYEKALEALTPEMVKDAAASFINGNLAEIVMRPDKTMEAE